MAVADPADLPTARALVEQVMRDVDEVASRFRDDSDLARVNAAPGTWVDVDPLLVAAVRVALAAAAATDGLVHPLLGRPLVELGYDRDLGLLVERPASADRPVLETDAPALDSWHRVATEDDAVRVPDGTALDLGATAKAWAVDLAATALEVHGLGPALVSIGGDLRTVGDDAWPVAVAEQPGTPLADADDLVELRAGALATSSTRVRRWTHAGVVRHHLLDPRAGQPAAETWRTVTVAASTCTEANTASTAAVVLGDTAPGWLTDRGYAARLVAADGAVTLVGPWPAPETPATPIGARS
ncbi:MAG: thiamine biosynthesis protein [Nocardioides sp.]|nr:thiamine biosynthesis protein [Nocardioides sp.]